MGVAERAGDAEDMAGGRGRGVAVARVSVPERRRRAARRAAPRARRRHARRLGENACLLRRGWACLSPWPLLQDVCEGHDDEGDMQHN